MHRKYRYLVYPDCCPVYTNQLLMLVKMNFLQHVLHRFILFFHCSRVSEMYRDILIADVQHYTFQ